VCVSCVVREKESERGQESVRDREKVMDGGQGGGRGENEIECEREYVCV